MYKTAIKPVMFYECATCSVTLREEDKLMEFRAEYWKESVLI